MSHTSEPPAMSPISPTPQRPRGRSRSVMLKMGVITSLILGLLIPLNLISGVIDERQIRKDQVIEEITQTWAKEQQFIGPLLAIPYQEITEMKNDKGQVRKETSRQVAYLLPQDFQVKSLIKPERRYRGIYQAIVYTTALTSQGSFDLDAMGELNIPKERILWNEVVLVMGIPHTKGISERPQLQWQGQAIELLPGTEDTPFLKTGLHTPVQVRPGQIKSTFQLTLSLKGSESFGVAPIGKQNRIEIQSNWTSPSFTGNLLPNHREVTDKGFRAIWEIPYFARSYGQVLSPTADIEQRLTESVIGVELLTPADFYQQSERAIKYGVLFLVLTFATYFLFEMIGKHRLHPFQYLLIGCAMSLFYLLLIALSEVTGFAWAYAIASIAITSSITLYSKAILGKIRRHTQYLIGSLLTLLYGYLYILLQLEDLSLLFGAIGLFLVLATIMFVTRNIDWYSEEAA